MGPSSAVRRLGAAGLALGLAVGLASCGENFAEQPPEDIFAAAVEDTARATAVHVKGGVSEKGQSMDIDLHISRDGACRGFVSQEKGRMEIRVVEKRIFIRGDQAFFEQSGLKPVEAAQMLEVMGTRWLEIPDRKAFGPLCNLDKLLGSFSGTDQDSDEDVGEADAAGISEIGGVDVVRLDASEDGSTVSVFVAVDDPHYIVRIVAPEDAENPGTITFSDYDIPVGTVVPNKRDIFEVPTEG